MRAMCARYLQKNAAAAVAKLFEAQVNVPLDVRYNVAPTQVVPVLRRQSAGGYALDGLRWGLIPFWARDERIGARMINARAETVEEKPAFREAFQGRRCVVPADGFYEWETVGKERLPSLVTRGDGEPMAFAGLWARWRPEAGAPALESFTILTCAPPADFTLHDRTPVILSEQDVARWLDPDAEAASLRALLAPLAGLTVTPLGKRVNDVRNDDPACLAPRGPAQPSLF